MGERFDSFDRRDDSRRGFRRDNFESDRRAFDRDRRFPPPPSDGVLPPDSGRFDGGRRFADRPFNEREMDRRRIDNQRGPLRGGYGDVERLDGRRGFFSADRAPNGFGGRRVVDRVLGPRPDRGLEGGEFGVPFGGEIGFPRGRPPAARRGPLRDRYYGDEYFFNDDRPGYLAVRDLLGGVRGAFGNLGFSPPWFDAAVGCVLYFFLTAAFKELHLFKSVAANDATARVLAISAFALIQDLAFLPAFRWLRLDAPRGTNPWNGIIAAFAFAVPFAALSADSTWLPKPKVFPGADGVLDRLVAAPISEELFYRAYLPTAFMAAGGSETGGLIVSTVLFALQHVPASGSAGSALFVAYLVLGAYLNFLYQRSGGSLPLVVVTHATLRLIELGGGRMLPF